MSRNRKERERLERVRLHKAGLEPYDLLKLTAFHEAGHAVYATLHDNPVEIVTVDPQKVLELTGRNCPGYTRYSKWGLANADYVLDMTAVGLTAEATLVSGGVINPEEDDLQCIDDMLNQMGLDGEEKQREFTRMRCRVQEFVEANRAAIVAVAEALMEKKTLTGADIDLVLKPS
jgi:ATP-dependent Zn protease